jgi:serine protease AprX
MDSQPSAFRCRVRAFRALAVLLLWPDPAIAQPARLSADLVDQLAANASAIDVIVHGSEAEVNALAGRHGASVQKYLRTGAVLRVSAQQLAAIQVEGSQDHLSSDVVIRSAATVSARTMLADRAWIGTDIAPPLSGAGVGVAVIDSGVDSRHETLWSRVVASVDFTGGDGTDGFGHGTHVAALIAGAPSWIADGVEFRGIAYDAGIVNLRVLDAAGFGRASSVIQAIDWAIDHRDRYQIRIINISLGTPVLQPYRDDPLCEAVERAVAAGLLVVTSAGNFGGVGFGGITSPGNDPGVITVGALATQDTAVRVDDTIADFSSHGPTAYDLVAKPDVLAPGTDVISARADGSWLAQQVGTLEDAAGSGYMSLTGTSMAAALVSGATALLFEQEPGLTADAVKVLLQVTSSAPFEAVVSGAAGSVNVGAALMLLRVLTGRNP